MPSWKEKLGKAISYIKQRPLADATISTALGFVPPPLNALLQSWWDKSRGSSEDKTKDILVLLSLLQSQGKDHFDSVSEDLRANLDAIVDNRIRLSDLIQKRTDEILREISQVGERQEAQAVILSEILKRVSTSTDGVRLECYELIAKGEAYSSNGDQTEAIRLYNEALKLDGNFAPAYNFRGKAFEKLKRYPEALAAYDKAINTSAPGNAESGAYWLNKSRLLQTQGNDQEAKSCYHKAIEIDPKLEADPLEPPDPSNPFLQQFRPLPAPTGLPPYHLSLDAVLPPESIASIVASGGISLHCVGSTGGIQNSNPQHAVAEAMSADLIGSSDQPAFFYHLGDIVYFYGSASLYYQQFYEPYRDYRAPIFAIPGNHDGDIQLGTSDSSLSAFLSNFCAPSSLANSDAKGIPRLTMTQPNVYWTLDAPFVTLVGLYSNVPQGGEFNDEQKSWLADELRKARKDKALIVAVHHSPFSMDPYRKRVGSTYVLGQLDSAFEKSGRSADLVLSANEHNYQRFTRRFDNRKIPYIVAGAGGYWHLHTLGRQSNGKPIMVPHEIAKSDVTLENYCDSRHGYLLLRITTKSVIGAYKAVSSKQRDSTNLGPQLIDSFEFDLQTHTLTGSGSRIEDLGATYKSRPGRNNSSL